MSSSKTRCETSKKFYAQDCLDRNSVYFDDKESSENNEIKLSTREQNLYYPPKNPEEGLPEPQELEENEEEELCRDSILTSVGCLSSLPLDKWTNLAQQTRTRPSVDKFTVSRFSPAEWYLHNEAVSRDADGSINDIKNIAFTSQQTENEIYNRVDENDLDNKYYLTVNARNLFNSKRELERINKDVTDELESTKNLIQQLMKSNRAVQSIINIDQDLKRVRNTRSEEDLVHDSVTEEILKDAKQRLEYDWSNKKDAYDIDTVCIGLNNNSKTIQWKPGCAQLPAGQCTPVGHEQLTKESIAYTQISINRSRVLKLNIKDHIDRFVKCLLLQACQVDVALANKFNETDQACRRLERALLECLKSLADSEKVIVDTSKAIRKLDAPIKCAQTRLNMRLRRQDIEQCRDFTQFSLIDQVKDVSDGVSALSSKINLTKDKSEELNNSYKKIQHEIMVKRKSLWIDGERCRAMRSFYPSEQTLYGYQ
ncbi:tektin-4-like [Microplitis demolitor]|uniref:tektin-4-like n=1 Tax=Microplitis demolitor TaxID=69319 RepID=UPI00235B5C9F|nr:tektin-4-like [Microplitis demolitor]